MPILNSDALREIESKIARWRDNNSRTPHGYPVDKWVLMMMEATGSTRVRNLGDVRWCATEDGSQGKGTGRHIAAFILGG